MSRHYKKHTKRNKFKKREKRGLWYYLGMLVLVLPFLYVFIGFTQYFVGNALLRKYGKRTKAVVTCYKNAGSLHYHPKFYYKFIFREKYYYGNSLIYYRERDRIGDSIDVVYLDFWPSMNRPTYFFD